MTLNKPISNNISKMDLLFLVVLLITATIASRQMVDNIEYSPFWPATGIALAAAVFYGPIGSIVVSVTLFIVASMHFGSLTSFEVNLTLVSLVVPTAAGLIVYFNRNKINLNYKQLSVKEVLTVYGLASVFITFPSAYLSAAVISFSELYEGATLTELFSIYWLSETAGALIFFVLIALFQFHKPQSSQLTALIVPLAVVILTAIWGLNASGLYKQIAIFICLPLLAYYALLEKNAFFIHITASLWMILSLYVAKDIPLPNEQHIEILFLSGLTLTLAGCVIAIHVIWLSTNKQRQLNNKIKYQSLRESRSELFNELGCKKLIQSMPSSSYVAFAFSLRENRDMFESLGNDIFPDIQKELAARLKHTLPPLDGICILGSSIIVAISSDEDAKHFDPSKLKSITEQKFLVDQSVDLKDISVAVVSFNQTDSNDNFIETINSAIYVARQHGLLRMFVGNSDDNRLKKPVKQFYEFQQLKLWLDKGYLAMWGQTISPLSNNNLPVKVELLARLQVPEVGLVTPDHFIPLIEQFGFETEFDKYVLQTCFKLISQFPVSNRKFSINVSAKSFAEKEFPALIADLTQTYSISAEMICFEITESNVIPDIDTTIKNIEELQQFGFTVGLDDFGTGFANFQYLMDIPFDFVKLDGRFVKNLTLESNSLRAVNALVAIATSSKMKTVAEYVETDSIAQILAMHNIDYAQGYGIDKPSPLALVEQVA